MTMRLGAITLSFLTFLALTSATEAEYFIGIDETRSLFTNETFITYDKGHGTQVEYIAAGGKTYLWYPGNAMIVRGNWKLTKTNKPKVFDMCFKYSANSYNPATGKTGGTWECQPAGFVLRGVFEHQQGDVFGLSRAKEVPFVLKKRKAGFKQLLRQMPH